MRETGGDLDGRIADIARRVFAEEWARVPAEPAAVEPEILPAPVAALRSICAGNVAPNVLRNVAGAEPETLQPIRNPCAYTEWDEQAGETYACGLLEHSPKVKHTRGARIA